MDSEALAAASAAFMEAANKMGLSASQTAAGLAGIAQKMNATSSQLGRLAANLESAAVGSRAQGTAARNAGLELNKVISSARASARSQDEFREAANRAANSMIDSVSDPRMKASIRRYADAQIDAADRAETFRNVISLASKPMGALGNVVGSTFAAYQSGSGSIGTAAALLQAEFKATGGFLTGLGQGITGLGTALGTTSLILAPTGFFAGAVRGLGIAASIAGPLITLLGNTANGIADKILPKLQQEVEKNIASFMTMTNSGALMAGGLGEMADAAGSAHLTLDQLAKVTAANKETFASLGEGVTGGMQRTLNVMMVGAEPFRKKLLGLGYTVEEQAGLIAETMKDMRGNGPMLPRDAATDEKVKQQTEKYAENLRVLANISGEDAKSKMKAARDAANNMAFQQKLDDLGPEQRKAAVDAMANMSEAEKKLYMEVMVNGQAITEGSAVLAQQMPTLNSTFQEMRAAADNGSLSMDRAMEIQARNQAAIEAEARGMNRNIGIAAQAGVGGVVGALAQGANQIRQANRNRTEEALRQAREAARGQANPEADSLQAEMINAINANQELNVAIGQATLQFGVMSTYMELASAGAELFVKSLQYVINQVNSLRSNRDREGIVQPRPTNDAMGMPIPGGGLTPEEIENNREIEERAQQRERLRTGIGNADARRRAAEEERRRNAPGSPYRQNQNIQPNVQPPSQPVQPNANANPGGTTVNPPVQATPNTRGASANIPAPAVGSPEWTRQQAAAYHTSGLVVQPNNPNATALPNGPNANETEQQRQTRASREAEARQRIDEQDEREARTPNQRTEAMQQQRASVPDLLERLGDTMGRVQTALTESLDKLAAIETNTKKTAGNTA
jgi:hypothetical protein